MTKAMIAVLGCVVLSGCAYRPIVDPARSDMALCNCLTGRGHAVLN